MCGSSKTNDDKIRLYFGWDHSSIKVNDITYGATDNETEVREELGKFTKKQLIDYFLELAINGEED